MSLLLVLVNNRQMLAFLLKIQDEVSWVNKYYWKGKEKACHVGKPYTHCKNVKKGMYSSYRNRPY